MYSKNGSKNGKPGHLKLVPKNPKQESKVLSLLDKLEKRTEKQMTSFVKEIVKLKKEQKKIKGKLEKTKALAAKAEKKRAKTEKKKSKKNKGKLKLVPT